jgi:hypothetical protein
VNTRLTPGPLAAAGFIVAAAATVWGSLEKIQTYRDELPGTSLYRVTVTWWELRVEGTPVAATPYPPYGVLLAVAAGLLVIAAVLAVGGDRLATAARVVSALGIGLLAGATGIRLMDGLQGVSQTNDRPVDVGHVVEFAIGLGIWLPAGAVLAGLLGLAALLAGRPRRPPRNIEQPATDP